MTSVWPTWPAETTCPRWRDELVRLLAAQAPRLDRKADRRNYSGKHRSHGLHFPRPDRRGHTHGNTAARHDHILAHLRTAGLGALADLGFRGLDNDIRDPVIVTGYLATRTHKLTHSEKEANRILAVGRAPVEHGFAHLKNWRIPTKLRTAPQLLRALLVVTNIEVNRRRMIFSGGSHPQPARVPGEPLTPAL